MEHKLEAAQETIVDQQQTVEKFRDLVHNLNMDLAEMRSMEERAGRGEGEGVESRASKADVVNINVQLKSAIKAQSRVRLLLLLFTSSCCGGGRLHEKSCDFVSLCLLLPDHRL